MQPEPNASRVAKWVVSKTQHNKSNSVTDVICNNQQVRDSTSTKIHFVASIPSIAEEAFPSLSHYSGFCTVMASSIALQGTLLQSHFLGQSNNPLNRTHRSLIPKESRFKLKTCAKFDLFELLGGRGLCNGEQGIQLELKRDTEASPAPAQEENSGSAAGAEASSTPSVPENAFEKELMGLTGGFPGGEKGLNKFIEENPPPKKQSANDSASLLVLATSKKPKAPELPLLMPGMVAIVSNPNNPYHMYCGIVQRITDGKAAVLFEGGNWDRLITFRLDELQRREKGPPGKNPRSAVLEE